ncbi:MAG: hypothetical protein Q7R79_01855, partial [bacterium]|nr:hypothetical protein [bacterium]
HNKRKDRDMHPAFGWAAGVVLAHALAIVYVSYVATSPTAETRRKNFVNHASKDVIAKLAKLQQGPSPEKLKSLRADIALLRKNVAVGWVTPEEQLAGVRVCAFVLGAHTKSTLVGIWESLKNTASAVEGSIDSVFDAIFALFPQDGDQEGNIRRHT